MFPVFQKSHHHSWIALHRLSSLLIIFFLIGSTGLYSQTTVYVNPNIGNDVNNGTLGLPFKTIEKALATVGNGGIVYLRGGTYAYSISNRRLMLNVVGTAGNRIRVWAYADEKPVIEFAGQTNGKGVEIFGSYYHFVVFSLCILLARAQGGTQP